MSEWGSKAPPSAGNHRLAQDDPRRLTHGLQTIVQNTSDLHQIARRLSSVRGKDPTARRQFSDALGRTKQAIEDTAQALASVGPTLPKAHYDKISHEYSQAKQTVLELEERGRRLLEEGERAEQNNPSNPQQIGSQQQQQQQNIELQLRVEDPTVAIAEERNKELEKLATDIGALRDIMNDAQQLVGEQGAQLNTANSNVEKAETNTSQAAVELGKAEKYARKRRLLILIIVLVVLAIIFVIVMIILGKLGVLNKGQGSS